MMKTERFASKTLIRSYQRSFNRFAAYLSQEEKQKLAESESFNDDGRIVPISEKWKGECRGGKISLATVLPKLVTSRDSLAAFDDAISMQRIQLRKCILISFVVVVSTIDEDRKVFIAYMGFLPEGEYSPSLHHYEILKNITRFASKALIRSYEKSFNGFAANLTQEEK